MLTVIFCIAIVVCAAAYTWTQDAKAGVNR